ncbi:hypothetical protein HYALB_00002927 [Hymenoscyphus albidus]|uniref:Uncharacterized protein n=1 Tax=Hymenoscyphus albidus TaxID=595503 RepID=A0A9N9LX56_9HELO|nr:hypothetical protein HYALB_00002927 [Hymenoscyphus albidus]
MSRKKSNEVGTWGFVCVRRRPAVESKFTDREAPEDRASPDSRRCSMLATFCGPVENEMLSETLKVKELEEIIHHHDVALFQRKEVKRHGAGFRIEKVGGFIDHLETNPLYDL